MPTPAIPSTLSTSSIPSTPTLPYRHRSHILARSKQATPNSNQKEEDSDLPPSGVQWRRRETMAKDHRFFHRRAAQPEPQVAAVIVEIIATVDTDGNIIAQETKTTAVTVPTDVSIASALAAAISSVVANAIPSATANVVSSAIAQDLSTTVAGVNSTAVAASSVAVSQNTGVSTLPTDAAVSPTSVTSKSPSTSDLVISPVSTYPSSSGVAVVQAVTTTNAVDPSATPTSATETSVTSTPVLVSATVSGLNSTLTGTAGLLSASASASASAFVPLDSNSAASAQSASQALFWSNTAFASEAVTKTIATTTTTSTDTATTTNYVGGAATGIAGNTANAPAAATTGADSNADNSPAPLETPQVVGSIVGSLAGAALIFAIILFLIRRHKRNRGGALQLTSDDHTDRHHPMTQTVISRGAVPSAFLNRFSAMSKSTVDTTTSGGTPSFQRVSGRKLPSAFSEGMTSEQFAPGGTMSGSSFYQDDYGTYGGAAFSKELGKEIGDPSTTMRSSVQMNFRPSPARTPVIRHPDDMPPVDTNRSHLSPPQSPNPALSSHGALGRSLHSADGSRSSRFTENV